MIAPCAPFKIFYPRPMPKITEHNPLVYKEKGGFDYPEFHETFLKTKLSVWSHEEVPMDADLRDWQYNSTPEEKELIAGILKGFVSTELGIGCYWADKVCSIFPKPEIQSMARAFSFFESIHASAYSYLNDVLGLEEYDAFINDEVARKKVEAFFDSYSDKVSLAVFSGAGEGVSLFSSFSVLLSFNRDGRYKGLSQIISWSAIDEQSHSDSGCDLFKYLVEETGLSEKEKEEIYEGFRLVIGNEDKFIDKYFSSNKFNSVGAKELKAYIRTRANDRLLKLGLDRIFELSFEETLLSKSISDWFDPVVKGASSNDFFAQGKDGRNYTSKVLQDFSSVNINSLDLNLESAFAL